MAGKVKTWVWVVIAVLVVVVLCFVTIAGVGFYYVSRQFDTKEVTPAAAEAEFDRVRAEFEGQQPLIELDSRGDVVRAHTDRPTPPNARPPEHLHVLAFDPDDGRIVRFSLPFWLLRLKTGNATIDLNGSRMNLEDLRLKIEDLERFGPTLIVDHKAPDGDRILVWSK